MRLLILIIPIIFFVSCGQQSESEELMRDATGEADELIVVVDSTVWNGTVGSEIRKTFARPMRGLPQDESLYDIHEVNPLKLNSVLKSVHNMIIVATLDKKNRQSRKIQNMFTDESLKKIQRDSSFFLATERNKFAKNQKVLYLFGKTEQQLAENISENRDELFKVFQQHTEKLTRQRIFKYREKGIEKEITENHGYSIKIPKGYELAKDLPDFVWFRELDNYNDKEKNIFIYERPYNGPEDFENIEALRDQITELHLRDSQKPEIYIQRQYGTKEHPIGVITEKVTFNGKYAIKALGLWAVSDLTHGGPFISYTMVDEEEQKLYYIEGYVYHAAGKKKRLMREVQAILSTFKTPTETKK